MSQHSLTDTQIAVYTYYKAHPDDAVYQICVRFGPYRGIDVLRLKSAVESAINSHPILKVRIETAADGTPYMRRCDDEPPIVVFYDDFNAFQNTVSLSGRLYCVAIIHNANGCELIVCVHHLVFDGYSTNVFINDISTAYFGGEIMTEKRDFFEVALDEIQQKNTANYQNAKEFFLKKFPPISARTMPLPDCDGRDYVPSFLTRQLPVTLQHWRQICEKIGASGNVVGTAVFAMVLGCFCGEDEARFSTVFHGRHGRDLARTVGMFVKTIPVSVSWQKDEPIKELLHRIRWQSARCMVNDIYPFSEIKKNCGGFDGVSFVYQGNTDSAEAFCGEKLKYSFLTPSYTGSSLSMELWRGVNNLEINVEYDGAKYSPQLIGNMIDAFAASLMSIENANTIGEIQFLQSEILTKLDSFNDNACAPNCDDILKMFYRTVEENPSAVAVKYLDKYLTYKELDEIANHYAVEYKSRGACAEKPVAISSERNEMMVISPLAVLKTGAAYVPLSPENQKSVLDKQLEVCNDDNSLTDRNFAIFFTSGSTGKPKGVKITRRNVAAYCQWYHRFFKPTVGTVIAAYNNFAFDAFITDVFPALTSGAMVAIVPQNIKKDLSALADFCDANNVNIIDLPTQIGRIFAANKRCKTLRHIVLGGEAVAPFQNCGNYQMYNQYGPTETTVAATIYKICGDETTIPIGKPLDCVKIYVVDSFGRRVPIGAIGEIWIAGAQVADGYLDESDNANKFIINPFDDNPDFAKVFRTGDYGRWREDGNLEFLGRRDNMVKIRGFRVEIGEIEAALKSCENVTDAAATTFPDSSGVLQIVAYVVGNEKLDLAKIRAELRRKLPPQMLPQNISQIDALPINSNGKIDRAKLPKPEYKPIFAKQSQRKLSTLEKTVCQVFAEVLNIDEINADDNFFDIGGTSISAMQVVVNLESKGIKIKYADIFEHPTAQGLAQLWSADGSSATSNQAAASAALNPVAASVLGRRAACTPPTDIIITGATGFFGAHLLNELLKSEKLKIYCIVRPKDGLSATDRIEKITTHYFGKSFLNRIQVIDGDITNPQIFRLLESLENKNVTIVNSAAIVKFFAEPKTMQAVNVDAVKSLTDLCLRRGWGLVQISTLSVENINKDSVPYVRSKFQAEQIALDAAANGLTLKIIRLGSLAPRSTDGVFQINADDNSVMNFVNVVRRLGCYPENIENQPFDIMPVDCAARDAAKIILGGEPSGLFNVCNPQKATIGEVVEAKKVSAEEFLRRLKGLPQKERLPIEILIPKLFSSDI